MNELAPFRNPGHSGKGGRTLDETEGSVVGSELKEGRPERKKESKETTEEKEIG